MSHQGNPIIPGFAPDPTIVKVGEWYFLVTSTFHLFPGLPVYASQDLVSWRQIGNVINRRTQLSLAQSDTTLCELGNPGDILLATGGLYAPTIRYYQETFYLVCTNVIHSNGKDSCENFIVSTSLAGIWSDSWSDPVYFQFDGIDPSIFRDDDGRAYIQGSAGPGPYTRINMFEINLKTGVKLSEERTIWGGTGGIYPEGPHLYKQHRHYYLVVSEGGTHEGHMVTMARATDIWGPYEACPHNPILKAPAGEYIQYTGHCDVFQDDRHRWWGVCLGIRQDNSSRNIMGRESFLTSGTWDSEWLSLEPVRANPHHRLEQTGCAVGLSEAPGVGYLHIRDAKLENYIVSGGCSISVLASPIDLPHPEESPTFIGKRQRLLSGKSTVIIPRVTQYRDRRSTSLICGLASYKDEHRYARIFYDTDSHTVNSEVVNNAKGITRTESHPLGDPTITISLGLRIEYTEDQYRMMYACKPDMGQNWTCLAMVDTLDMTNSDFTGPVIGIFAVGQHRTAVRFENLDIN